MCLDVLVTFTLACSKLSIVFFYRRMLVTRVHRGRDWMSIATWATIVVIVLWLFVFEFLTGFECGTHLAALWDGSYNEFCVLSFATLYGLAISDFLLDLWILVLPIPKILHIHAPLSKKLSLIGIFLLAFVSFGACIARMALYIDVENGGAGYLFSHSEMKLTTEQFYYNLLEAGMSCVAINLPSLWTLVSDFSVEDVKSSARSLFLRSGRKSSKAATDLLAGTKSAPSHEEDEICDSKRVSTLRKSSYGGYANASHIEAQSPSAWTSLELETDEKGSSKRQNSIQVTQEYGVSRTWQTKPDML